MSYDAFNWCQWVAGFTTTVREEKIEVKNSMLEYLTKIMEDAKDLGNQPKPLMLCCCAEWRMGKLIGVKLKRMQ